MNFPADRRFLLAPSILSADFARLGEDVSAVLAAGADIVHFDVMDNHYVPNLSVGPMVCQALRRYGIKAPVDVHLMVTPVDRLIEDFVEAGASSISFHPEATVHVDRALHRIREAGCKAGLVLNPSTSLEVLEWVGHRLDFILLMSVNPGFAGQRFIPQIEKKISTLASWLTAQGLSVPIAVDGGVTVSNVGRLAAAGAEIFVAGSAIFGQPDYAAAIAAFRWALMGGQA